MPASSFLKKPKYFKELSLKNGETIFLSEPKALRAVLGLMDMQAALGGAASHWGGPAALIEILSALMAFVFREGKNWPEAFHIINDIGHSQNGFYALQWNYEYAGLSLHDLKKFRSIEGFLTGHGESHLFPEGVYLSNGPLGSTIAQAQGLSIADKLEGKKRITVLLASDGALMEGEAKEALASIPGWAKKEKTNPFLLIVSDNNTKLSGRIDEDSFSMKPSLESLKELGWKVLHLEKAHDLKQTLLSLESAIETAGDNPSQPVCLRAQTIKGRGLRETELAASGGHGWPFKDPYTLETFLKEIYGEEKIPDEFLAWSKEMVSQYDSKKKPPKKTAANTAAPREKTQAGISRALIKKAKEGFKIISISADLQGSTGVLPFRKMFPEKSFDAGVAEANMFSVASGLSKQGFIPVVDTFAQFGVSKGALPLFMASLSQAPIIAILSHIGFQDSADGASHQCLTYLAQTGSIPKTKIFTLSSSSEAQSLLEQAIDVFKKEKSHFIFFLGRETFRPSYLPEKESYQLGRAQILFSNKEGSKEKACTIVSSGTLVEEALKAGKKLAGDGWRIFVLHLSLINEPDIQTLSQCLAQTNGRLLTVEDHQIKGGMGAFISQALSLNRIPFQIHSLGVKGEFGRSAYKALDLYHRHGLSAEGIDRTLRKKDLFTKGGL